MEDPNRSYEYQTLKNDDTIRILVLEPGEWADPLTGMLEINSIDSAGQYEALSYVWADPGPTDSAYEIFLQILGNGRNPLTLRGGSIFAALRQLRFRNQRRRIWADQCCINQDDAEERSQQLQFMNRIYRRATRVVVWLGLDAKQEAAPAFKFIHDLDLEFKRCILPDGSVAPCFDTRLVDAQVRGRHGTLRALTDRAWFKRGWIVQEIGTGTPATMIWGNASIDWDTLAGVCERLKTHHRLRSVLRINTSDISFLYRRFIEPNENSHHANRFNFVYELQRSRHLQFTDDRDRVFAFLGHFSSKSLHRLGCGPVEVVPDYKKTVEQVYIDLAIRIVSASPAAFCIVLVAVVHTVLQSPEIHNAGLPSWVPDWRQSGGIILGEPICHHRAHGDTTPKLEIVGESCPVLRSQGVEIDQVEECSWPMVHTEFYLEESAGYPVTLVERLWRRLCQKDDFNLDDKYLNGQSAFFAFMQTLSNGCVQAAGHECNAYDEFPDHMWLQKAAGYVAQITGARGRLTEELRNLSKALDRDDHYQQWSRWAAAASDRRVFARTKTGYYVLGPAALEAGDVVCVLFGAKVPFCLRPLNGRYMLVGECYVHGLMKGEAVDMLKDGHVSEKRFDIV